MPYQSWLEGLEIGPDGKSMPYEIVPKDFSLHPVTPPDNDFPNCCEEHLMSFQEIRDWAISFLPEGEAVKLAKKTLYNLAFTESYIIFTYKNDDWYEDISYFIEYNIFSFGSSNNYAERYLLKLIGFLKTFESLDSNKFKKLSDLTFIWWKNIAFCRDLLHLRRAFDKWFYCFPFDISFLNHLKDKYDLFFGIVNDDFIEYDEESFMVELNKITDSILSWHNTSNLHKNRLLVDPSKIRLELIISKRNFELQIGFFEPDGSAIKQDYREKILRWFIDEIKYIDDITPFVTPPIPLPVKMINQVIISITSELDNYQFSEFLASKGINKELISDLMNEHSGKELMPYSIALLNEIGFLKTFLTRFKPKENAYKKLAAIFDVDPRRIRGNVTILNPKSKEDPTQYGSISYVDSIKERLSGLI